MSSPITITIGHRALSLCLPDADTDEQQRRISTQRAFDQGEVLQHLEGQAKADQLLLDVGAGFGNCAVFGAGLCGLRVEAFEPHPRSRQALIANIELNGLGPLVRVHDCALGQDFTTARFSRIGGRGLELAPGGTTPVRPLDSVELSAPPSLVRIGVRRHALAILLGAESLLREHRPKLYVETDQVADAVAIVQLLQNWGYEAQHQLGETPTLFFCPVEPAPKLSGEAGAGDASAAHWLTGSQEALEDVYSAVSRLVTQLEKLQSRFPAPPSNGQAALLENLGTSLAELGLKLPQAEEHSAQAETSESIAAQLGRLEVAFWQHRTLVSAAIEAIPQLVTYVNEQTVAARRLEAQVTSMRLIQQRSSPPRLDKPPAAERVSNVSSSNTRRKWRKLVHDPAKFLADSKQPWLRGLGKVLTR